MITNESKLLDKRYVHLMMRYWFAVEHYIFDVDKKYNFTLSYLSRAIEFEEYSRAESILDGLYQRFGYEKLSPF